MRRIWRIYPIGTALHVISLREINVVRRRFYSKAVCTQSNIFKNKFDITERICLSLHLIVYRLGYIIKVRTRMEPNGDEVKSNRNV